MTDDELDDELMEAWKRGELVVVTEVDAETRKRLLDALDTNPHWIPDPRDDSPANAVDRLVGRDKTAGQAET